MDLFGNLSNSGLPWKFICLKESVGVGVSHINEDIPWDSWPYAPFLLLRFGVALAKVRTKFEKKIRRKAFVFLRKALKCKEQYNTKQRINRAWVAGADLQPVFDFLTSQ
jgi:hypothetical protein